MFYINNDLNRLRFDYHNIGHVIISFLLALLWGFPISYGAGFLWEIGDGVKPWYYDAPKEIKTAKLLTLNWFKREILYSNKFSLQDIFVWNLAGALCGEIARMII